MVKATLLESQYLVGVYLRPSEERLRPMLSLREIRELYPHLPDERTVTNEVTEGHEWEA
jgi:hypothetical protein